MSRATPDDQLKFLLSCVRHSNAGKVSPDVHATGPTPDKQQIDFVEVAQECGVVSKGAAAKRYERLLKTNGIHPSGGVTDRSSTTAPKQKSRADIVKSALAKKRKIEGETFVTRDDDDEDDHNPYVKAEQADMPQIKPEPDTEYHWDPNQNMGRPPPPPFFPRNPPPIMMHNPFAQPYPSMHQSHQQPHPHQFPASPYHQPQQSFHSSTPSQQAPLPSPNLSAPTQQLSITYEQPAPAVPEEQIQSMFDEFCSQDMFRQPEFGAPSHAVTTTVNNNRSSTSVPGIRSPQPSSAAVLATTISTLQTHQPETNIKAEPDAETTVVAPVDEPTGSGFEDCILITD